MRKVISILLSFMSLSTVYGQLKDSPSWRDFARKSTSGNWGTSTLTDFSYAGYKFSNEELPNTSGWNIVKVKDHGARPDDGTEDNTGIQNAINAAQNSNMPSIVLFESGRYVINKNSIKTIVVSKSNIVLRGTGSGSGGTEIFCEKHFNPAQTNGADPIGDWAFYIRSNSNSPKVATITEKVNRGSFVITVANNSSLSVGQTVSIKQENLGNRSVNGVSYASTSFTNQWTRINDKGLATRELHVIKSINGKKITLQNPVLLTLPDVSNTDLFEMKPLKNVGIESIKFSGDWPSYGENFIHHKPGDNTHDQGWSGLLFERVQDSWINNCEFRNWNEAVEFNNVLAMTVKNSSFTGKKAHASFAAKQSTGLLFKNIVDNQSSIHGPGWQISSCGIVCSNYKLKKDQAIDLHAANPYANLFDGMSGVFDQNGGSVSNYPNAGPYNTFWNFVHDSDDNRKTLDFWSLTNRKLWTFANPVFVGLTSTGNGVTLRNAGKNESYGTKVYPPLLFDAQFQLRTYGGYMLGASEKEVGNAEFANDTKTSTFWESNNSVANQWLQLDFGTPKTINKVFIDERSSVIGNYKIQHWKNNAWVDLKSGSGIGANKTISFTSTNVLMIRILVQTKKSGSSDSSIQINTFGLNTLGNVNNPPIVNITSPANNAVYSVGDEIDLKATATDPDGSVVKVNFKLNDDFYKTDSSDPYEQTFTPASAGTYKIAARAFDSDDAIKEVFVTVTVEDALNQPPTVSFVSPIDNAIFTLGDDITLEVNTFDSDGTIAKVNFRINDEFFAQSIESPYRKVFTPTEAGAYTILARSADDKDATSTAIITITVEPANQAPEGSFSEPANLKEFEFGYDTLYVLVDASDPDGDEVSVELSIDGIAIRTEVNAPYEWGHVAGSTDFTSETGGLSIGTHTLEAVITDENGLSATVARTITVIDKVTSLENETSKPVLIIFPNPSTGVFYIDQNMDWKIYTFVGEMVLSGNSDKIDLSSFTSGVFVLETKYGRQKIVMK